MKLIVLGGDGFCGWPASLYFSDLGYDVKILDNLSRRKIDIDLGVDSLTPIRTINERITAWREVSGRSIAFDAIDIATDYERLLHCLDEYKPDCIIHFAEQRAAPYSMKNAMTKRYTVDNNTNGTHNLLCAMVECKSDAHLVHLGTMGVYGYGTSNMQIPEGYLNVNIQDANNNGKIIKKEILYPTDPGSIYHLTKTLDQLLFHYYAKNDKLRITDLHQGIVWGTQTTQTLLDERLINRFDYDGDYGTVLNRFLVQSVINYPLTVHGTGGQTRAFININDTLKCLELALNTAPQRGERVKIYNQITETHRVKDLARMVCDITGTEIDLVPNPRNEADSNDLFVSNDLFLKQGLRPTYLNTGLLEEITQIVKHYSNRINTSLIPCKSVWNK
jgi:UDP-sulfoquinovose synthase